MAVLDAHLGDVDDGDGSDAEDALSALERAATMLQRADLDMQDDESEMQVVRRLEVVRRRLDHGADRVAGHLDTSGAHAVDGHRGAGAALTHLGRLPRAEARQRVATMRSLRRLPHVAAAYERGVLPTAHVRAIVRVVANPRVGRYLDFADPVFAEQAATETYPEFCRWLREWERLADADGAERDRATSYDNRHAELVENPDGGFSLQAGLGALEGASMNEVLERFIEAETLADWAEARNRLGEIANDTDLLRSHRQRRADALTAIFRRAASATGAPAVPLVNILVDQATFENELARAAGRRPEPIDPLGELGSRRCQALDGAPLHPSEAVAAALVGHVRRVVVDADSNVIDLGRRRRLFTGSSRDAALIQGALCGRDGLVCGWHGCRRRRGLQIDHAEAAARGGATDIVNSLPLCGFHNRLKEHGWRPVRGPDGRWSILRPNGTAIIPPA